MCTLTPTVRLNSFAMTKQIAPVYEEVPCKVKKEEVLAAPAAPVIAPSSSSFPAPIVPKTRSEFRFNLTFEGFKVEGCAKTKQNAKHDAAEKMIEKLKDKYPQHFSTKSKLDTEGEMLVMLGAKKLTPIYQYVREEGSSENRRYTVKCMVGTLQVEGSGKGKKSARLDAAQKVLKYFQEHDKLPDKKSEEETAATNGNAAKVDIKEKVEGCLFKDPISVLQEYLVHNNLDPPSYSTEIEDKVYTITGTAGGISYSASARNKKLAKQCAAAGVLAIIGVKERPKKKPKKKNMRNNRYKFRYLAPQVKIGARQFGFEGMFTRPKVYEPSQRALNFNRRNPDEDPWMQPQQPRPVQNYYDIF